MLDLPDARARDVYGYDLILVRPDLHVVWRGNALPATPADSPPSPPGIRVTAGTGPN